jgi:4-aminobutyrate---pyruvate transaminase
MQPISALMVNDRVFAAMLDESKKVGNFAHGFTYAGHPVATAVALETLRIYDEMDMVPHVQRVGAYLQQVMGRFASHPIVGDVRGVGLLSALEMMADKATRTPFDPARKAGTIADGHARANGLIVRSVGDRIAFSPPLIITEAEVDELAVRLQKTLDATWAELKTN